MSQLRVAVVGVGSLGQHHARILSGFDHVDLVAVADPRPQQGQEIAERFGTSWVEDASLLPNDLHAVVIASPTIYHYQAASQFLKQGVATFVEKPLAANLDEARILANLASSHDTLLQVGHIERFNPTFTLLKSRVETPLYLNFQRVSPYSFRSTDIGAVHDLMIHDIDLALALTGEFPESVESFGTVIIGPHEDSAIARLRMPSGTIVDLTCNRVAPSAQRSCQVWSANGCTSADLHSRQITHWGPASNLQGNTDSIHEIIGATTNPLSLKDKVFGEWIETQTQEAAATDALTVELDSFLSCTVTGDTPIVSGTEAVSAMHVADLILTNMQKWSFQQPKMPKVALGQKAA